MQNCFPLTAENSPSTRYAGYVLGARTMLKLGWEPVMFRRCLQSSSIWSRMYSSPVPRVGAHGTCAVCELPRRNLKSGEMGPAIQLYILWCPSELKTGLNGRLTVLLGCAACAAWHRQVGWGTGKNISSMSHCRMGHIDSPSSNMLVIFLNKGLVRKGVEWLHHQLFFPISILLATPTPVLQPPSSSAPRPHTVPRASPSFFTSLLCVKKNQQSCRHADHVVLLSLQTSSCPLFIDNCCSPALAAFWARRGCVGVCLLSTKHSRLLINHGSSQAWCSTVAAAAAADKSLWQRSLLVSFNERVISVDIGWSKRLYHSITLVL